MIVASNSLCDVVRAQREIVVRPSGVVASAGGCRDDNLPPIGDENGSSFAVDLDLRWYPGVGISCFTVNLCSVSVFLSVFLRGCE